MRSVHRDWDFWDALTERPGVAFVFVGHHPTASRKLYTHLARIFS